MIEFYRVKSIKLVGRQAEQQKLLEIASKKDPSIIIVYGRRRVGKTELIEQTYKNRNILKFEGIENQSDDYQRNSFLQELYRYTKNSMFLRIKPQNWREVLDVLADCIEQIPNKKITLFLEELQWMANYSNDLISELKHCWDNRLRKIQGLVLVLCGSAPSFMINNVIRSKAIHNRSLYEIPLKPFSLDETREFLGKDHTKMQILNAQLLVGGIPEYLKYLKNNKAIYLNLCKNSFTPGGFFLGEYQKVFVSSLQKNEYYRQIIEFLAKKRFATRNEIIKHLNISSNGLLTTTLQDLALCGFVVQYTPFSTNEDSLLKRYEIADPYLQFYNRSIRPLKKKIEDGDYVDNPTLAFPLERASSWLGFSFERFCRANSKLFAKKLGFSAVHYHSGSFFNRQMQKDNPNFQLDLVFDRADGIYTVCEIKYTNHPISITDVKDFNKKITYLGELKKRTIHKVLISISGATAKLKNSGIFDEILTIEDL